MRTYKITAVSCDWKDHYEPKHLNQCLQFVGNGARFTDVEDTYSDQYVTICASPPVTPKQAQRLFDVGDYHVCDNWEGTMNQILRKLRLRAEEL